MPSLYPLGWKYYFMKTTYLTKRTFIKLTNASVSNNNDISIGMPSKCVEVSNKCSALPCKVKFWQWNMLSLSIIGFKLAFDNLERMGIQYRTMTERFYSFTLT